MSTTKYEVKQAPHRCPYVWQECGLEKGCPYENYRKTMRKITRHFIGQVLSCNWRIKEMT